MGDWASEAQTYVFSCSTKNDIVHVLFTYNTFFFFLPRFFDFFGGFLEFPGRLIGGVYIMIAESRLTF